MSVDMIHSFFPSPTMCFSALLLASASVASVHAASSSLPAGVIATGTQGARLLTVNSIDDFCLFAPPYLANVSDTETIEVAWCTKLRNNARLIPDGTITGVTFLKTDFYIQIMGIGDFTKLNIPAADEGGELDPHGAFGTGNPVGGNVTTNIVDGLDEPIAEWMLYISGTQFCLRACTNANSTYSAAFMCWHELDVMGCEFVMPGMYKPPGTFESCDADVAYPPGWYPSVFFTGVFTGNNGSTNPFTVGDTVTPTGPFSTPGSSNCVTTSTIANGVDLAQLTTAGGSAAASATPASAGASKTASGSTAPTGSSAAFRAARIGYGGGSEYAGVAFVSLIAGIAAIGLLH
ncbi:hypothetical protein B0H10DRAFT_2426993 [Mycena sp. CBHHK59/15]|nr:hypothetical protein B0H10DRAFT_2426993 [Mycena sp. CBHHK59/15]